MGMDVYGKNPTNKTGEYFRNNCWWWRPLVRYCCEVAPDITKACQYWQSNDGDGLNADDSLELADALQSEIDAGRTAEYALIYQNTLDSLPRKTCQWCNGSGTRKDNVGVDNGMVTRKIETPEHPRFGQEGWCNGCDGIGTRESDDASYPFSLENVREFIAFLRSCGGFEIC